MLYRVVYLSSARQRFDTVELDRLLAASRRRNARDAITGLLLHDEEHFIQALEGEDAVLPSLMRRIESDPRHCGMSYIAASPVSNRMFGRWAMAFGRAAGDSLPAMVDRMTVSEDGTSDVALAMLKVFMRTVRPERPVMQPPGLRRLPLEPPLPRKQPQIAALL